MDAMAGRIRARHSYWDGKRKNFIIAITSSGLLIILLFLGNFAYLYGSLFRSNATRVRALDILAVDYDNGLVGQSVGAAYARLQGADFPTLRFASVAEYPTQQSVRDAVCRGDYWGAVIAQPGASDRLAAAMAGGGSSTYDAANTLTYVYNSVNYAAVELGSVYGNLETLIGAATPAYHALWVQNASTTTTTLPLNTSDPASILAFTDPIRASGIDIMPTPASTKVLWNTVSMVLPIIQQFFYLLALNGISNSFSIYGRLTSSRIGILRCIVSLTYTLLASLTMAGYIWAFDEGWAVDGAQFVLTWLVLWLYMHIHFTVLDTATAVIPISYLPFFVLTWAVANVTSTIYPFDLSPGFYRWGHALPAHNTYSVLVTIWSGGCNNRLYRALPILFSWEAVGLAAAILGMHYRNHKARREILQAEDEATRATGSSLGKKGEDARARLMEVQRTDAGPGFIMPSLLKSRHYEEGEGLRRSGTAAW